MQKMISDVRLFQESLAELVSVLTDSIQARQRHLVNQRLTAMLKPTRSVITNYDLSEDDQHAIINGTSNVIALVKTYNASWEELEIKNQALYNHGHDKNLLHQKLSQESIRSTNSTRDVIVDSAVVAAMAAGVNEDGEFDLNCTPLHDQLFAAIDELALTFSSAVTAHLTSLSPPTPPSRAVLATHHMGGDGSNSPQNQNYYSNNVVHHHHHHHHLGSRNDIDDSQSNPSTLDDLENQTQSGSGSFHQHQMHAGSTALNHQPPNATGQPASAACSPPLILQNIEFNCNDIHQVDRILASLDNGVDRGIERIKLTMKYSSILVSYIESRTKGLTDYGKTVSRSIKEYHLTENSTAYHPLQSVLEVMVMQDQELAKRSGLLRENSNVYVLNPLIQIKSETEKNISVIHKYWSGERNNYIEKVKKYHKSRRIYKQRLEEKQVLERNTSELNKSNTINKQGLLKQNSSSNICPENTVLEQKVEQALDSFKSSTEQANQAYSRSRTSKFKVLGAVREVARRYEQTIKTSFDQYIKLQKDIFDSVPACLEAWEEKVKLFAAGNSYAEYIVHMFGDGPDENELDYAPPFQYEETKLKNKSNHPKFDTHSSESRSIDDLDLENSSNEGILDDNNSHSSPVITKEQHNSVATTSSKAQSSTIKRIAKGFKRLKAQRSRSANSQDNSLESLMRNPHHHAQLDQQLSGLSLENKLNNRVFANELEVLYPPVPYVLTSCSQDIEKRGITCKGIYRVNGVKTRVDALVKEFERMEAGIENNKPYTPDLSQYSAHDISSVLKRFLQQLPDPLFTFALYDDFMRVSRNYEKSKSEMHALQDACELIRQMPASHRACLAIMLKHLNQVSLYSDENKMTPSNLGVVFGPTLFRAKPKQQSGQNPTNSKTIRGSYQPPNLTASSILEEIKDMPDQARLIELLIINRDYIANYAFTPDRPTVAVLTRV